MFKTRTATFPLIGMNMILFLVQVILGETFTNSFTLVPADILIRPWILITSMFLHGSFAHLFFNMYALLIFGPIVESRIGKRRFYFMYFLSGIFAAIGYSLMSTMPALGASGAIMGLLGVTIILLPDLPVLFFFFIPMSLRTAGIIFALIDIFGVFNPASGIAHWAHLFGLATGLIYGIYLLKKRKHFQESFDTLKKYSEPTPKSKAKKTHKQEIRNADFSYSEKIQLTDSDIDNYLKNGRL